MSRQTKIIIFLLIITLSLTSCEPLRKKFTRKKKKGQEVLEVIPVLDPIDYPPPVFDPEREYKLHFSLWKVWHKDLLTVLEERGSQKRQLYILDQLLTQLEELQKLLESTKKEELSKQSQQLQLVKNDLNAVLINSFAIKKRLLSIDKDVRNNFNFDKMKENLIK